ncbi:TIGR01906 family membrane protein [Arthrobacter sp. Z1-9]
MKDETPARARRAEPQPEPVLDTSGDSDEPAFSWLTPAGTGTGSTATDRPNGSAGDGQAATPVRGGTADAGSTATSAGPAAARTGGSSGVGAATGAATPEARQAVQPESRADRKAAESTIEDPGPASSLDSSPVFKERLPTSALQVRPPEEEVERRNAQRESAANAKPVAPRVMQVLLALFFPLILLILAVRAVTSPLFLWVEYNRPGFPGDGYGFSTDDRMTYGSYAVDYLSNWAGPRYLGDLVHRSGDKLFKDGEVSHMADVKLVILSTFGAGVLLILVSIIAVLYLRKRSRGGVRRGLFAGSIITLVLILGLGSLAVLGWQQFFTEFHRIFFADGSWTFSLDDTLIRLFPGQFWIDAGMVIAGLVLLTALVTLILTWPTRRRRGLAKDEPAEDQPAGQA